MSAELASIDLTDHDVFEAGMPYDWFAALRQEDPVHWQEEADGPGFWCVTRHADVRTVHRDPATFSSQLGGTSLEDPTPEHLEQRRSLIDTDPPEHGKLRAIIGGAFTPRAVREHADAIRAMSIEVIERALEQRDVDFVEAVAAEIPMGVFCELLGAPQADRRKIVDMGDRLLGVTDPELVDPKEREGLGHLPFSSPAALEFFEYGRALAEQRRADPRDDVVTRLVQGTIDGRPLTQREYDVYFVMLATAGNETARHTISHGLLAFIENPEERQKLLRDPSLADRVVEESLRWATPVIHFRRTVTTDVEFGGRQLRRGDKLTTWLASANRDETVFDRPDEFLIERTPNPHVSFGPGGPHFCIGAGLARLELSIVFEELLTRVGDVELTGPVDRLRSNFFNAIKRMPVRLTPA